jgi:hypothetical protein
MNQLAMARKNDLASLKRRAAKSATQWREQQDMMYGSGWSDPREDHRLVKRAVVEVDGELVEDEWGMRTVVRVLYYMRCMCGWERSGMKEEHAVEVSRVNALWDGHMNRIMAGKVRSTKRRRTPVEVKQVGREHWKRMAAKARFRRQWWKAESSALIADSDWSEREREWDAPLVTSEQGRQIRWRLSPELEAMPWGPTRREALEARR